jgi:hypothetical protein
MEYYYLQENGLIKVLQEKINDLDLHLQYKIQLLISEALESEIEKLPEDIQMQVEDELIALASDLNYHIENLILDL